MMTILWFALWIIGGLILLGAIDTFGDGQLEQKFNKAIRKIKKQPPPKTFSTAYKTGYKDMAYGLYLERAIPASRAEFTVSVKNDKLSLYDKDTMEYLAGFDEVIRDFNPENGRRSEGYLSGSNEDWEQYYSGGMQFLSDLDDMQAEVADKKRMLEIRRAGAREADARIMENKKALYELRNSTYNNLGISEDFNRKMRELIAETQKPTERD